MVYSPPPRKIAQTSKNAPRYAAVRHDNEQSSAQTSRPPTKKKKRKKNQKPATVTYTHSTPPEKKAPKPAKTKKAKRKPSATISQHARRTSAPITLSLGAATLITLASTAVATGQVVYTNTVAPLTKHTMVCDTINDEFEELVDRSNRLIEPSGNPATPVKKLNPSTPLTTPTIISYLHATDAQPHQTSDLLKTLIIADLLRAPANENVHISADDHDFTVLNNSLISINDTLLATPEATKTDQDDPVSNIPQTTLPTTKETESLDLHIPPAHYEDVFAREDIREALKSLNTDAVDLINSVGATSVQKPECHSSEQTFDVARTNAEMSTRLARIDDNIELINHELESAEIDYWCEPKTTKYVDKARDQLKDQIDIADARQKVMAEDMGQYSDGNDYQVVKDTPAQLDNLRSHLEITPPNCDDIQPFEHEHNYDQAVARKKSIDELVTLYAKDYSDTLEHNKKLKQIFEENKD